MTTDDIVGELRAKWIGEYVTITNVVDGVPDSAAGVVVDIVHKQDALWPVEIHLDWGYAMPWHAVPETLIEKPSERPDQDDDFLTARQQAKCTCGLIGPWKKVRSSHLTTCAISGGTST